jgi:hypothetical protein
MLQNRVDPFGNIIKTPERGAWMGNRGVIHNHDKEIVRPYKLKAWITCVLQFRGRHREVMTPDRWTELFFMDEATAFGAGHRPCAECRREDFNRFKKYWLFGNAEVGFNEKTSISLIDNFVHVERVDKKNCKRTHKQMAEQLPDGTMIMISGRAYVKKEDRIFEWSPGGYINAVEIPGGEVDVLTPSSFVKAFQAGYLPQIHVSSMEI